MNNVMTIGRRLVAIEQIAFIEPFDASSASGIETTKSFQARIKLVNRDSCLAEASVEDLAIEYNFRLLKEDRVGINPLVDYRVETFEPTEDFTPAKPFKTRLLWDDPRGNECSKLLVTAPEDVLAVVTANDNSAAVIEKGSGPPNRTKRQRSTKRPSRQPA
ncbi:hypothetical protein QWJ07_24450 [Frankia sp. RB7]|nr:hypothetical protein [Frankia sp. RB7]